MSAPNRSPGETGLYEGRRVLVLGASGFIGRWVVAALSEHGARVTALVRDPGQAPPQIQASNRVTLVRGDVEQGSARADSLARLMAELRPSVTFNLVGYGVRPGQDDPETAKRLNTDLVGRLIELAAGVHDETWPGNAVVHAGTQAEYGPELIPESLYGRTKLEGSLLAARCALDTGLPTVVGRVFNVYGPGEPEHRLLPTLIRRASDGDPIDLTSGLQKRDFMFVRDVAEGMLRLGVAAPLRGEPVNLATGHLMAVRELVLLAAQQLHISPGRLRFGALPDRTSEGSSRAVSVRRLGELTGWSATTSLEVGIRETVAQARQSSSARATVNDRKRE